MLAEVRVAATHNTPTRWATLVLCLLMGLWTAGLAMAGEEDDTELPSAAGAVETAPVVIDGVTLFVVRGSQSFAAEERTAKIKERIVDVANRDQDGLVNVVVRPSEFGPAVYADGTYITVVTEADADLEGF